MRPTPLVRPLAALLIVAAPWLVVSSALAQAGGAGATLSGRVTTGGGSTPLADATVFIAGRTEIATTNDQGRYIIRNAPTGKLRVRVIRVGYAARTDSITLSRGESATLDFEMTAAAVQLQDVVVTATGEQRKVELGHSVATLGDVNTKVETSPVTDMADLLVQKTPGMNVETPNMTGAAATIRLRGISSLAPAGSGISNAPIVVVDGQIIQSGTANLSVGGTTNSFLNNIDPDEIQDIEIVKGPAASTLYGSEAGNGVIVITTKLGTAGNTKWTWYGENGTVDDRNKYPTEYAEWGHNAAGALKRCVNATVAAGTCTIDSVTSYNVMTNPATSPLYLGRRQAYGAQVSGGNDAVRYFASGDLQNELGPVKMPGFSVASLNSLNVPMQGLWEYPEQYQQQNFRANMSAALSPKADLNVNFGVAKSDQHLPQTDNNIYSFLYSAFQNPGFNRILTGATATAMGYTGVGTLGEALNGYGTYTPRDIFQYETTSDIQRILGTADANWRPFTWMQNEGTLGMDLADNVAYSLCAFATCPNNGVLRLGQVSDATNNTRNFTAKAHSTSSWQAQPWLDLKTTVGFDYLNQENDLTSATGITLPPGAVSVSQAATVTVGRSTEPTATKTLGYFVDEAIALRDRLFFDFALRTDENSAFGSNFQSITYPKASVSWLASDEPFFPRIGWLSSLRLRSAYGESGVLPGPTVALQAFGAATGTLGTPTAITGVNTAGLIGTAIGNPNLKPEISAEGEAGFDAGLLKDRVHLEMTYYSKQTHDALINLNIAPSAGAPFSGTTAPAVLTNVASTKNAGLEVTFNASLVQSRNFGWDITIGASHNSNKIVSLGNTTLCSNGQAICARMTTGSTGTSRDTVGLPINAWVFAPFYLNDPNKLPVAASMVSIANSHDSVVYMGYSQPRDITSIQQGFDFLRGMLHINALFDYKGGYDLFNNTGSFYAQQTNGWATVSNPKASIADQARTVAERYYTGPNSLTTIGYLENGSFWRFRELSAAYRLPQQIANVGRAHDATVVLSARNLHVWTKYTGIDPESNYGTGDSPTDFSTIAPPTYYILRVNLHY